MNDGRLPAAMDLQQVFISYRRDDSAAYAGRIYDAMVGRFGEDNVFMDVEMPPGVDFVERIDAVVSDCAALIVVIGPNWAGIGDDAQPRLHDETDFVRHEVAAALRRNDVTVIPALVGGAAMPPASKLPDDLRPLARRNALELSDGRWRYDVGRLNATLDAVVGPEPATEPRPEPVPLPQPSDPLEAVRLPLEGAAVAAVAAFAGRWIGDQTPSLEGRVGEVIELALQRAPVWGLVGLALALWLGWRKDRTDFGRLAVTGLVAGLLAGVLGAMVFGIPYRTAGIAEEQQPIWAVLSLATSGAFVGGMLGSLWRPPRLAIGLLGGLAGGVVGRLVLNTTHWWRGPFNRKSEMYDPTTLELATSFAFLAALVAAGALLALNLLSRQR